MKFAEHLSAHITPEWRQAYINYEVCKCLKIWYTKLWKEKPPFCSLWLVVVLAQASICHLSHVYLQWNACFCHTASNWVLSFFSIWEFFFLFVIYTLDNQTFIYVFSIEFIANTHTYTRACSLLTHNKLIYSSLQRHSEANQHGKNYNTSNAMRTYLFSVKFIKWRKTQPRKRRIRKISIGCQNRLKCIC